MMPMPVTQQQIVEALQQVPPERWGDVLHILNTLKSGAPTVSDASSPIQTGADLLGSELIGIWANRADITNSGDFARQLRHEASHRQLKGKSDAAGH